MCQKNKRFESGGAHGRGLVGVYASVGAKVSDHVIITDSSPPSLFTAAKKTYSGPLTRKSKQKHIARLRGVPLL